VNYFNTSILLLAPGLFFATLGYLLGGWVGMWLCAGAYGLLAVVACRNGERILLVKHRATRLPEDQSPGLHALVRQLASRAAVPMPALFLLPEASPQLMVTELASNRGSIAMSTGLLTLLTREEVAAVIAQALSHLRNGETRPMTLAAVLAHGLISISNCFRWSHLPGLKFIRIEQQNGIPSDAFLWVVIAPVATAAIRVVVYPSRQFRVDEASTRLIGDPEPLCAALLKIRMHISNVQPEVVSPATAHLFLSRTQPPENERIHRLRTMYSHNRFSTPGLKTAAPTVTTQLSNLKEQL
jgi:heat shock protein HtpX